MQSRLVQVAIVAAVAIGLGFLVVGSADGWADWVVFGAIVVTFIGFAIAIAPNIYARRKRVISRSSADSSRD